jgi:hypothetical protein
VKLTLVGAMALGAVIQSGCSAENRAPATDARAAIESIQTPLGAASCRKEIDKTDPDETPYLLCPGVAGYSLIVRRVDSGRRSIDVVDPAQRVMPLNYQDVVTRHMSSLADSAEWRVANRDGRQVPLALVVRVRAREDGDQPEKVTASYAAVAKITSNEVCVTDRIADGPQAEAAIRAAADSAQGRACAPALPRLAADAAPFAAPPGVVE